MSTQFNCQNISTSIYSIKSNSSNSNKSVQHNYAVSISKQFYFKQFSLAWVHSLIIKKDFFFKLFSLVKQF